MYVPVGPSVVRPAGHLLDLAGGEPGANGAQHRPELRPRHVPQGQPAHRVGTAQRPAQVRRRRSPLGVDEGPPELWHGAGPHRVPAGAQRAREAPVGIETCRDRDLDESEMGNQSRMGRRLGFPLFSCEIFVPRAIF
jgi:hypothetical protein